MIVVLDACQIMKERSEIGHTAMNCSVSQKMKDVPEMIIAWSPKNGFASSGDIICMS